MGLDTGGRGVGGERAGGVSGRGSSQFFQAVAFAMVTATDIRGL